MECQLVVENDEVAGIFTERDFRKYPYRRR